ncbi:hypothetical protein F4677DRAFT_427812 [Hypoxylon crocopeplum]|nr:hypothetical protein F4677DRAFT_427812 [Hypoxylon crocopeplum]
MKNNTTLIILAYLLPTGTCVSKLGIINLLAALNFHKLRFPSSLDHALYSLITYLGNSRELHCKAANTGARE